jgi:hypothetical protein
MKDKVKLYICTALAALALVSAVSAGAVSAAAKGIGQSAGFAGENTAYLLREYEGHVAIYYEGFDRTPAVVTEIEIAQLPLADQELLTEGLNVADREELLLLLEDLGS